MGIYFPSLGTLPNFSDQQLTDRLEMMTGPSGEIDECNLAGLLVECLTRRDPQTKEPSEIALKARAYIASEAFEANEALPTALADVFLGKYQYPLCLPALNQPFAHTTLATPIKVALVQEAALILASKAEGHPLETFLGVGCSTDFNKFRPVLQETWVRSAVDLASTKRSDHAKLDLTRLVGFGLESLDSRITAVVNLPRFVKGLPDMVGPLMKPLSGCLTSWDKTLCSHAKTSLKELLPDLPIEPLKTLKGYLEGEGSFNKMDLIEAALAEKSSSPAQAFPGGGGVDGPTTRRAPIGKKFALCL